ncbi:membrane protein insertion efficiency factor YidD [Geodermatophilus sp. DF01-2]|uniref:membrane protein insertion efficiency factor YidD n=1 Tax=Geodermatophilus sp. DF01-2 TaxID=2559610 RepID=UPI00142FE82A|nr:membrane protein insertion efficiency factor YidD [Geodermatophilus sp. DF01_2]
MTTDPGSHGHGRPAARGGRRPVARALLAVVGFYMRAVSPALPPRCRFAPTCSAYAAEAIAVHGAGRGSWLALRRLLKCAPWHPGGFDPVPAARTFSPGTDRPVPSAPRRAPQEESSLA